MHSKYNKCEIPWNDQMFKKRFKISSDKNIFVWVIIFCIFSQIRKKIVSFHKKPSYVSYSSLGKKF
jgi:hypothetical protein